MEEIKIKIIEKGIYNIIVCKYQGVTEFHIQRNGYGLILHCVGVVKLKESIENFIEKNLKDWIEFYNEDLEKIRKSLKIGFFFLFSFWYYVTLRKMCVRRNVKNT